MALYSIHGTSSACPFSRNRRFRSWRSKSTREKAARYGVNMSDVQNVIQTGVGQRPVSTVYVGERALSSDGAILA